MLQQTQVERVEKKFPEFIGRFPSLEALASAPLSDLLSCWQGMGYNRRALALKRCAAILVDEYDGSFPRDTKTLATLPGIGPATAASFAAFAFNEPVVFIETNIRRVFIHYFFPYTESVPDASIIPLAEKALYRKNPRVWYWSVMDLGTALRMQFPNPNRRSTHYSRQTPFFGSEREIRGALLREGLQHPGIHRVDLIKKTGAGSGRVQRLLDGLVAEGFLKYYGETVVPGD
jgi:A/G-specific adenine glycosylase